MANVVQAFAPREIAVGGAIALHNGDAVLGPITRHLGSYVMVDVPDIRLAEAGEDAVLYGSIISARERHTDPG